jgi:hypothetical protein
MLNILIKGAMMVKTLIVFILIAAVFSIPMFLAPLEAEGKVGYIAQTINLNR